MSTKRRVRQTAPRRLIRARSASEARSTGHKRCWGADAMRAGFNHGGNYLRPCVPVSPQPRRRPISTPNASCGPAAPRAALTRPVPAPSFNRMRRPALQRLPHLSALASRPARPKAVIRLIRPMRPIRPTRSDDPDPSNAPNPSAAIPLPLVRRIRLAPSLRESVPAPVAACGSQAVPTSFSG
jgi:hypothetical protein